jgi:hypothetical protein
MTKIKQIELAIENAIQRKSKLSAEALNVPALTSLNIRHLLNNLCSLSTIYVDSGSHVGGSFCSAVYGNNNLKKAVAIDSWHPNHMNGEQDEIDFRKNASKFTPKETDLIILKSDTFQLDLGLCPQNVDFYYFDAGHSEIEQYKALMYYYPILADRFIFCVDDYMLDEVRKGTEDAIVDSKVKVLFEKEFVTDSEYSNESWWRGWKLFYLEKK